MGQNTRDCIQKSEELTLPEPFREESTKEERLKFKGFPTPLRRQQPL